MDLEQIRYVKMILRELFYFRKLINKYGNSLLPGQYYLFPDMRAIAADRPETIERANAYFAKKRPSSKLTRLIGKLNQVGFYCNKNRNSEGVYEAVYSANNYDKIREIKLFSFQKQQILTICTSEVACEAQLEEYARWHKWFAMPPVTAQQQYDHAYIIAMVNLLPRPAETEALEHIAQCICNYSKDNPESVKKAPAQQLARFSYSEEMNDLLNALAKKISPEVMALDIPLCLQHGDLSRDNLIYGICDSQTGFWWIDWEHAKQRPFFYDYFFYILNTAVYFSDFEGLQAYLSGCCDCHLEALFSQLGMPYDPAFRKDYFLLFAIVFLKERVCDPGNQAALAMYVDFFNKHL